VKDIVTTQERPGWHDVEAEALLRDLRTDERGLTEAEATRRLAEHGRNELLFDEATARWKIFLRQFVSPLIGILVICAVVTALLQHWVDFGAIVIVLLLNAGIGYWQERKAENDVRALRSLSAPTARVLRYGVVRHIPAAELTVGDVVPLESGERVPADLRLLEVNALQVDESMLTGEAMPATKRSGSIDESAVVADRVNMAFSGTLVAAGRGRGVVVAVGDGTELGAINALVQGPGGKSPLQELTHALERRIGIVVALAATTVFIAGMWLGGEPAQAFLTAVALAVASVPESLPIVLTVAMSLGVSRMARRRAVVRSLPAVETLGSTTVIASDKTGTLTENRMRVEAVWTAHGHATDHSDDLVRQALRAGALTNEAELTQQGYRGDAVDVAMVRAAVDEGEVSEDERASGVLAHTPYEPELRYSQTVRREGDERVLYVKGAPDAIVEASVHLAGGLSWPEDATRVLAANDQLAGRGLRVIATAKRVLEHGEDTTDPLPPPSGLTLLGLEGLADPPRAGAAEAVARTREAGIEVKMVTGDHPGTARAIADRLGLPAEEPPLTGAEMATLDDRSLLERIHATSVAARVSPQDKLRLVRTLSDDDHVVAVTGDGVNDAPALKAAQIGVAMGASGTDVAREAADVVLTDDNFVTIVDAVEQGRVTFSAIRKATFFLLSTGAASIIAVLTNTFIEGAILFLPVQMLWINIVTNGIQDIALAFEPGEGDELRRPPRPRAEGVLSTAYWWRTLITGSWMAVVLLAVFQWNLAAGMEETYARNVAILVFVMLNFFHVMSARAEYRSVFTLSLLRNPLLIFAALGALLLHLGATHWPVSADLLGFVPLGAGEWLVAIALGSTVLFLVEGEKAIRRWAAARRRAAQSRH
jgi:P-type Ca2+ transporter type 2C